MRVPRLQATDAVLDDNNHALIMMSKSIAPRLLMQEQSWKMHKKEEFKRFGMAFEFLLRQKDWRAEFKRTPFLA
jgi:hypothetical protein